MPSEGTLRDAAAELRRHADAAAVLLDEVTRRATDELWSGPVADRFASELGHQRGQLRTARDELYATAAGLERQADELQRAREAAEAARQRQLAQERAAAPHADAPATSSPPSWSRFVE